MNIEEVFNAEIYHNYGLLTTEEANILINYLKEEVMEYIAELLKELNDRHAVDFDAAAKQFLEEIAMLEKKLAEEARLNGMGAEREAKLLARVTELEEQNLNMMALFRDFYELEFNRDECWEIIKKYGGDA